MRLKGAKFCVTGGNRGIGLGVAEMAASSGAHIFVASRSWETDLEARLKDRGAASVTLWKADLSSKEGTESLARLLQENEIDILFNNAGLLTGGLVEEQNLDEIYQMLQVNLNAVIHLSRAVIPGMIKRGRGKIVNNSSVSAFMHFPCASTYAASKAALVAFTDCIEAELQGTGVSTLCLITPGIKTRMFDDIESKYSKNFDVPQQSITTEAYAKKIKFAIEHNQTYLLPDGSTAIGLWIARYVNPLFRSVIQSKFKR